MKNISVINESLWQNVKAGNVNYNAELYDGTLGFNMIRIKPNFEKWAWRNDAEDVKKILDRTITGVMINDFSYSMTSEWGNMATPFDSGLGNILGGIGTAAGGGELGSVFKSKKYWKKSGYVDMQPQVRFIDIYGDGLPLMSVGYLLLWAVAVNDSDPDDTLKNIAEFTRNGAEKLADKVLGFVKPKGKKTDNLSTATVTAQEQAYTATEAIKRGVTNAAEDFTDLFTLKVSPPPLEVEIGRIFKHTDMVLSQVELSFSSERGPAGPMYIDATLHLSSRKIVSTIKDIGIYNAVDGNVEILDNTGLSLDSNIYSNIHK